MSTSASTCCRIASFGAPARKREFIFVAAGHRDLRRRHRRCSRTRPRRDARVAAEQEQVPEGRDREGRQGIEEIQRLKEQTAALLARKQIVETLQANRTEAVHLLDQLVRQLPDGIFLKAVKQTNDKINLTGYAQSNARIATLMRNLDGSPWLAQSRAGRDQGGPAQQPARQRVQPQRPAREKRAAAADAVKPAPRKEKAA
jgi:Tfp pilus assembly protein PilN